MHGNDVAVLVPHEVTLRKLSTPRWASSALVGRS